MNRWTQPFTFVLKSPLLWGSLASFAFFALIHSDAWNPELLRRYCAGHPVEYTETALFFVGLAALAIKALEVCFQYPGLSRPVLGPFHRGAQQVADCDSMLARLARASAHAQNDYRIRRLQRALESVRRNGTAEGLNDELKYLADEDVAQAYASYGLVRMIIWAIPILGFLGTVIGIAIAMGNLSPKDLEKSLPEVMAGLTVAFDTTALALTLCMILFFAQFYIDKAENRLLALADERVNAELVGRFECIQAGPEGQLVAVRRMIEALIQSTERAHQGQVELWREAIQAVGQHSADMADRAARQLEAALAGALAENVKIHARELAAAERATSDKSHAHWERVGQALTRNAEALASLQKGVTAQADILGRAVEAAGHVRKLEHELNQNLAALAGSKNFEETVISLAAAIQLLTSRLGALPASLPRVQLDPERLKSQAA